MYDLKAVFSIQDKGTATIRRITQEMNKLNQVMKQVSGSSDSFNRAQRQVNSAVTNTSNVVNRNTSTVNNNTSAVINNVTQINRFSAASRSATSSIHSQSSALSGLKSTLMGVAGAYIGVQGASKAFDSVIGGAAKFEMAQVTLQAMFDDKALSDSYMKMMDKIAIDSPVLNSMDMVSGSKGLLALTKDLGTLEQSWKTIEKLNVLAPEAGVDGAVFAMKELASADVVSMAERFNIPKKFLHSIKGLTFAEQLDALDKMLAKMNITDKVVEEMGKTSIGQWNSLNERASTFMRAIGEEPNSKLGQVLFDINEAFGKLNTKKLAKQIGDVLGKGLQNVVNFTKKVWTMRDSIAKAAKVVGTFIGAFAGIVIIAKTITGIGAAIAFLTSPIGLVAGAITGLIYGFKTLYDNSEKFRDVINRIKTSVSELVSAFKTDGVNGLLTQLLPPGMASVLIAGLTKVSDFVTTFRQVMDGGLLTGILGRDKGAVAAAVGFANGIKSAFSKVSDFVITFKQVMAGGLLTGILDRDQGAVAKAVSLANGIKTAFTTVKEYISSKITELQPTFEKLGETFTNIKDIVTTALSTLWNVAGPILSTLWNALQILGDIVVIVFNNVILPAFQMATMAASVLWSVMGPILELLGAVLKVVGEVVLWLWDVAFKPFFSFLTSGMASISEKVMPVLNNIKSVFEKIGGAISTAAGYVKDFASKLGSVKIPGWVGKIGSGAMNFVSKMIPGNYHGLNSVPYDNYLTNLHKGEMVLTRQDADTYRSLFNNDGSFSGVSAVDGVSYEQASSGLTQNTYNSTSTTINGGTTNGKSTQSTPSISIAKLADSIVVREDADIDRIADGLVTKILERRGVTA
ncbi:uncharacterized protein YukE/Flp pilus assembly pilin Flp [Lysinibacillus parviboronicapiens]|uniref:Uncharacterized protein YukE/Flp pilus assembly pilin Flp n=1 Tax=Lysinibacillus parviboronicapiens TaxID=436516 RepID=A0ABV2PKU0_9BACI